MDMNLVAIFLFSACVGVSIYALIHLIVFNRKKRAVIKAIDKFLERD